MVIHFCLLAKAFGRLAIDDHGIGQRMSHSSLLDHFFAFRDCVTVTVVGRNLARVQVITRTVFAQLEVTHCFQKINLKRLISDLKYY